MSTDRELLELAAKAVGFSDYYVSEWVGGASLMHSPDPKIGPVEWDPLTDDGDRLRLIRELKMIIDYADCGVSARYNCDRHLAQEWWGGDEGDEAHAVLRVAAEIGKAMP